MRKTTGLALLTPGGSLEPWTFERRDLRPDDLAVRVTWCGVCHTDLHAVQDHTGGPLVPGHEFVGVVTEVGEDVRGFAVGDSVAVGNIVDSCGVCASCRNGDEQFCAEFPTLGIREVSELTGVSVDALRWYEREGVLPEISRTADGCRRYSAGAVRFVRLVQALRRTGMPVAEVRRFVELGPGTPDNSALRLEVLLRQEAAVEARMGELREDRRVLRAKIANYRDLIARGEDCEDEY